MTRARVKIPLQDLLLALRRARKDDKPKAEQLAWRAWAMAWANPTAYRLSTESAAKIGRVLPAKAFPDGWAAGREIPRARKGRSLRAKMAKGEL